MYTHIDIYVYVPLYIYIYIYIYMEALCGRLQAFQLDPEHPEKSFNNQALSV